MVVRTVARQDPPRHPFPSQLPFNNSSRSLSPLDAALTPVLILRHLKSFRMNTYTKAGGRAPLMLTKILSSVTSKVNSPSPCFAVHVAPIAKIARPQVLCLPLLQTPPSAKSFPCHSYENTRGGVCSANLRVPRASALSRLRSSRRPTAHKPDISATDTSLATASLSISCGHFPSPIGVGVLANPGQSSQLSIERLT